MEAHVTNPADIAVGKKLDNEVFLVEKVTQATTRDNSPYYDVVLRNSKGVCSIKIWTILDKIERYNYIRPIMTGKKHPKYGPQWQVDSYQVLPGYVPDELFKAMQKTVDADSLFDEMTNYPYQNKTILKIRDELVMLPGLADRFKTFPASLKNHHSFKGGLVQHTWEVWSLVRRSLPVLTPLFGKFNEDIALFGAFIHDISKCYEYEYDVASGEATSLPISGLLNNTVAGLLVLEELTRRCSPPLDRNVMLMLQHIIVSHQTRQDWASPVPPMTPEALIVAQMDQLSANCEHINNAMLEDKDPGNPHFTSSYFYYNPNGSSQRVYKVPEIDNNYG